MRQVKLKLGGKDFALATLLALTGCAMGQKGVKVSERWGFDPVDSTRIIQKAFDSGEKIIILDRQAGPWYVLPLKGRSNQTIVIEKGAELKAKRGAYQNATDSLITFSHATNVVLSGGGMISMWHDDYLDAAKYCRSEWRHAIALFGSESVLIENLTISASGGDGVYLGDAGNNPNRHVIVRDCLFDYNHRQGCSVISAADLTIERCVFKNTRGTPPEDGIDFEPNRPGQSLENCLVRDCIFENNAGRAVEVVLYQFDSTSKPVSIRVENCKSTGNLGGLNYLGSKKDITVPVDDGRVDVVNCVFEKEIGCAVSIAKKMFSSGTVAFRDCLFDRCNVKDPAKPDVDILVTGHEVYPTDVVLFENVTIRQGAKREWLSKPRLKSYCGKPTQLVGAVKVLAPDGSEEVTTLDACWNATRHPSIPGKPVVTLKPVQFSPSKFVAVDAKPGEMVKMSPVSIRGRNKYAFFASKSGIVRFVCHQRRVGKREPGKGEIILSAYGTSAPIMKKPMPMSFEAESLEFDISAPGLYTLQVSGGKGNGFLFDAADVPLAVDSVSSYVSLIYPEGDVYVYVPTGGRFGMYGMGDGLENFSAEVFDPSGKCVHMQEHSLESFHYASPEDSLEGLWRLRLGKPSLGVLEDSAIRLTGVPGFIFLSAEKFWK